MSGRAMLEALVRGTTDSAVLADLACGARRKKRPALRQAQTDRFRAHHAFLVGQMLAYLDCLDEAIPTLSDHLAKLPRSFRGDPGAPGRYSGPEVW